MSKIGSNASSQRVKSNSPLKPSPVKNQGNPDLKKFLANSPNLNLKEPLSEILSREKLLSKNEKNLSNKYIEEKKTDPSQIVIVEEDHENDEIKNALNEKETEKNREKISKSEANSEDINENVKVNEEVLSRDMIDNKDARSSLNSQNFLNNSDSANPEAILNQVFLRSEPYFVQPVFKSNPFLSRNKSNDFSSQSSKSSSKISPLKRPAQEPKKNSVLKDDPKIDLMSSIDNIFSEEAEQKSSPVKVQKSPEKITGKNSKVVKKNISSGSISASPLKKYNSMERITSGASVNEISKDSSSIKVEKGKDIYDKFYKIVNKPRPEPINDKETNKKSTPSRTSEQVDSVLYEDAVRRASTHYEFTEYPEISTSIKSQQLIAKKFIKEFIENIEKLKIDPENIDQSSMISLLQSFNFIKNDPEIINSELENSYPLKFWKHLTEENTVEKSKLLSACLALIGIFSSQVLKDPGFEVSEVFSVASIQNSLAIEEEIRIHKTFAVFFENRQVLSKPVRKIAEPEYSFKPQLNPETENLAKKRKDEIGDIHSQKRYEYNIQERQKALEKAEKAKIEREMAELEKCTFKPKIKTNSKFDKKSPEKTTSQEHRTLALYEKSKQVKEKQIKSSQEIELEKNLAECTFAPQIKRLTLKEETNGLYSLSVQKNILRLQKAREEEARKKGFFEGGTHSKSLSVDSDIEKRPRSPPKAGCPRYSKSPDKVMSMIDLSAFDSKNIFEGKIEEVDEEQEGIARNVYS